MKAVNLVFPHQLFEANPLFENKGKYYILEEPLLFKQYNFHKQKLAFHRASMKCYENYLLQQGKEVVYVESGNPQSDVRQCIKTLKKQGVTHVHYVHPTDTWLEQRIAKACGSSMARHIYESPLFFNNSEEVKSYFGTERTKYHQTNFYKNQRKLRQLLLDATGNPTGGKWTYDVENRKKYPRKKTPPPVQYPDVDPYYSEAIAYVNANFGANLGTLSQQPRYPTNFQDAANWLDQFLEQRFAEFGPFEDALVSTASILHHSVLSPMLNVGLISPQTVLSKSIAYAQMHNIPLNSLEGFVRQLLGWREFIRGIYEYRGTFERTRNYWDFTRTIPPSFYNGTTGILPVDNCIKKALQTGYCHHIERLMVLGNFMLLCEFSPNAVYQWFMELFIDAYDWVMVPNVYGMSQFADGGLMSTKPYISGSNYLMKMSDYEKGDWQPIWDGLFWRFMHLRRDFFLKNPRLGMLVRMFDKMPEEKQKQHLQIAERYLASLG